MKRIKLILIVLLGTILQGCPGESEDEPDARLTIKNTSNELIYYPFDYDAVELVPKRYPVKPYHKLNSGDKATINIYFDSLNGDYKLWILIYKKATFDTHTWEEIKEQGLYDKRFEFTLEQLKSMNYELIYDGN